MTRHNSKHEIKRHVKKLGVRCTNRLLVSVTTFMLLMIIIRNSMYYISNIYAQRSTLLTKVNTLPACVPIIH